MFDKLKKGSEGVVDEELLEAVPLIPLGAETTCKVPP